MNEEIMEEALKFKRTMRNSVIEMGQLTDSMDYILEHIETLKSEKAELDKVASLLKVLSRGLTTCREVSEDSIMLFEQYLIELKQKQEPTSSANEVSL